MKNLFFIPVACLCLLSCGGSSKKNMAENAKKPLPETNDLKKEGISGQVDSIRQRVYWCLEKFGRMEKGKLQNLSAYDFLKVYDEYGFLVEETHFNAQDEIVSIRRITHNDSYLPVEEVLFKGTEPDGSIEYSYNEKNQKVRMTKFSKDGKVRERTEYIYHDNSDLLMDEDQYNSEGKLSAKYVHLYYNGKLSERQKYWGGGSLAQKEYYSYDENGRLVFVTSDTYANNVATFEKRTDYAYESAPDYTYKMETKRNENPIRTFRQYDRFGNITDNMLLTGIPPKPSADEADYDEDAEENDADYAEESEQETDFNWVFRSGEAYTYAYDEKNNWTQKITYKYTSRGEKTRQFYYDRVITTYK